MEQKILKRLMNKFLNKIFANKKLFVFLICSFFLFNFPLLSKIFESFFDTTPIFFLWIVIFFLLTHFIFLLLLNIFINTQILMYLVIIFGGFISFYAMRFGVVFDTEMWRNVFQTNLNEATDLLSLNLLIHFCLFIAIPIFLIKYFKFKIKDSFKERLLSRATIMLISILLILSGSWIASSHTADFLRNHKSLRYLNTPSYGIFNLIKFSYDSIFLNRSFKDENYSIKVEEHHVPLEREELIVFVVGETARYDHFGINGYERDTTPNLSKLKHLISFSQVESCGTTTAVSVPCIFALQREKDFKVKKARYKTNLLDILPRDEVNVHWFDNNSDSKHVADRIPYLNFKSSDQNKICDTECRDVGMIPEIKNVINPKIDNLIILHQMGSHGPAYFKRYPSVFEKFKPACHLEDLSKCTHEEIINAYDNTILYTDYFLSELIKELRTLTNLYEVTLIYVSDHGESLGEKGIYLHGLPKAIAPDTQKHVPVFIWAPEGSSDVNFKETLKLKDNQYHHGNVSDMILRLLEVETDAYKYDDTSMVVRSH